MFPCIAFAQHPSDREYSGRKVEFIQHRNGSVQEIVIGVVECKSYQALSASNAYRLVQIAHTYCSQIVVLKTPHLGLEPLW